MILPGIFKNGRVLNLLTLFPLKLVFPFQYR